MSTLRVSNIEAKADVSSPSVNEKVKVTNSNGELLVHIDGATLGITTVGINTSGESVRFDSNQNVTFFGDITGTGLDINGNADISGNLNVGGVLTYEDVTNIDSVGVITARSGIHVTGGQLNVAGNMQFTAADPELEFNNGGPRFRVPAANTLTVHTGGGLGATTNERLRIDSSGRLLVGTVSAEDSAIIQSNGVSPASFYRASGSGGPNVSFKRSRGNLPTVYTPVVDNDNLGTINFSGSDGSAYVEGAKIFAEVDGDPGSNDMPGALIFATTADGAPTPTERLRITSAGNAQFTGNIDLGNVSTSSNSNTGSRLETSGQLLLQLSSSIGSGNQNGIAVYYGNTLKTTIKNDGSATFAGGALAIASSGNLSINRTSGTNDVFNGKLNGTATSTINADGSSLFKGVCVVDRSVSGDGCFHARLNGVTKASITSSGSATFASFNDGSTSGFGVKINIAANAGDVRAQCQSTASQYTRLYDGLKGTSTVFSVLANGNLTVSGNVTAANVSDIRFKENITDANPQLADAVALGSQIKNFDWKDNAPLNEELRAKRFLGLVAQEAEKVCPGLTYTVPRTKQGEELTPETTDAEGNVTPATYEELDDSYKAINHDILVMKLLGAVSEQNTQIETLKTQNASLEARLTALEGS